MVDKQVLEHLDCLLYALRKTLWKHSLDLLSGLVLNPLSKKIAIQNTPSEFRGVSRLVSARWLTRKSVDGAFLDGPAEVGYAKFAIRKGLPGPNEKRMAVENEAHTVDDFDGVIKEGYGKGKKELVYSGPAIIKSANSRWIGKVNLHRHQAARAGLHYDLVAEGVRPGTRQFEINIASGDFKGRYAFLSPDGFPDNQRLITRMKDDGLIISKPNFNLKNVEFLKEIEKNPGEWIVEWKADGGLANLVIKDNRAIFRSHRDTGETYYDKLPALESLANKSNLFSNRFLFPGPALDGTILRGELFHDEGAARVGGILNSAPDKAIRYQQEHGNVRFYAWDIAKYKNKDVSNLPYAERRVLYESAIEDIRRFNPNYAVIPSIPRGMFVQGYTNIITDKRGLPYSEGVCIKRGDSTSSEPWFKIKFRETLDVAVVGFTEGTGKYKNSLGSILVETNGGGRGEVGTGWSDTQRQWIWSNKDILQGQIAEIYAQEITKSGSVRAGVFYRWHASKSEAALLMYSLDDRNSMYAMKASKGWVRKR